MIKRPTSITVISWFLIVSGTISLISTTLNFGNPMVVEIMRKSPVPVNIQYGIIYVSTIISMTCGILFLRRVNWARYLYIIWSALGFTFSFITSPIRLLVIPSLVIFGILAYILLRKPANEYFKHAAETNNDQKDT